jgi:hypothetical protein
MPETHGTMPSHPSHPPSDPQPSILRPAGDLAASASDRPVRVQLFVALLLGLVLVATGLYLWRRPRSTPDTSSEEEARALATAALLADAGTTASSSGVADAGAAASSVTTSEPQTIACQDRGPKHTPAEQCDHLAPVEQALTKAIEQTASCVPPSAGGGTIQYLADVSFLHKRISVKVPKTGHSMRNAKALVACGSAVKQALDAVSVDSLQHTHARYKIAVTATYPGPIKK